MGAELLNRFNWLMAVLGTDKEAAARDALFETLRAAA